MIQHIVALTMFKSWGIANGRLLFVTLLHRHDPSISCKMEHPSFRSSIWFLKLSFGNFRWWAVANMLFPCIICSATKKAVSSLLPCWTLACNMHVQKMDCTAILRDGFPCEMDDHEPLIRCNLPMAHIVKPPLVSQTDQCCWWLNPAKYHIVGYIFHCIPISCFYPWYSHDKKPQYIHLIVGFLSPHVMAHMEVS